LPQISKHEHQPKMFNGSMVFAHSLFIEFKRESEGDPPAFGDFRDIATKIIHFRYVQLKFYLKTFETFSLLSISVLKCSILAIILFEYLLLNPSAKKGPKIVQGAKKFQGCMRSLPHYFPRL